MSLLAVAPIDVEYDAMVRGLLDLGFPSPGLSSDGIPRSTFADGTLVIAQGGLGKVQFAVQTAHLLAQSAVPVDLVLCVGTAGAIAEGLRVGDVVVATESVEHDSGRGSPAPKPRFPGDGRAIGVLGDVWADGDARFAVHFGPVASGDEGIMSRERARELAELTGAVAVAWEGVGGARAAALAGVPFLEVRGISDSSDGWTADEWMAAVPRAMVGVAAAVGHLHAAWQRGDS